MCGLHDRQVARDVLRSVPPPGDQPEFEKCQHDLLKVRCGSRVLAADEGVQEDLDGLIGMVANLAIGKPPALSLDGMKDLSKMMLKRLEDTYRVKALKMQDEAEDGSTSRGFAVVTLSGAEAVRHTYEQIKCMVDDSPGDVKLQMLRPLRQFKWCLSAAQYASVCEWIRMSTAQACPGLFKSICAGAASDEAFAVVPADASSSSSAGMHHMLGADLKSTPSKKAKDKSDKASEELDDVMSFFRTKSRRVL